MSQHPQWEDGAGIRLFFPFSGQQTCRKIEQKLSQRKQSLKNRSEINSMKPPKLKYVVYTQSLLSTSFAQYDAIFPAMACYQPSRIIFYPVTTLPITNKLNIFWVSRL